MKFIEREHLPTSTAEVDQTNDMMIWENSNLTNKSQAALASKHCNVIFKYVCPLIERKN
jgi:predicted CoA-binding protein